MKKTGIIYVATDTARNNRRYIGQTIQTLKERKRGEYNRCFQNAINDHGDQIEWKIAEEVPIEELDTMERLYIWGLDTIHPNGYNFESGGHKNKILSEETKRKLSKALKGKTVSKEARKNMSIAAKNRPPPSQEARENMSRAQKGKITSEETKQKMSKSQKGEKSYMYGKHHSEETKRKISEAEKGEKHHLYGKHHSKESKQKMSEAHKGKKLTEEHKKKISESRRGEKVNSAKLTETEVKEIREKYATGNYTQTYLAKEYGVYFTTINKIIHRKTWKHI